MSAKASGRKRETERTCGCATKRSCRCWASAAARFNACGTADASVTPFLGARAATISRRWSVWSRNRSSSAIRKGWKISNVITCCARAAATKRKDKGMGLLETETFELWMSKIMERFDRHDQMLSKLAGKEIKEVKYLDGERLLDNQDLCQLLQASKRSLQRYRSSGTLRYQMLWHKIYYKESDVQEFLKNHFDEFEGCRKVDKRGR